MNGIFQLSSSFKAKKNTLQGSSHFQKSDKWNKKSIFYSKVCFKNNNKLNKFHWYFTQPTVWDENRWLSASVCACECVSCSWHLTSASFSQIQATDPDHPDRYFPLHTSFSVWHPLNLLLLFSLQFSIDFVLIHLLNPSPLKS